MDHPAFSPFGKLVVVLVSVAAVAAGLNLVFAHTLHYEPLGLLTFGLFCIGYSSLIRHLSRKRENRDENLKTAAVPVFPLQRRDVPIAVWEERARKSESAKPAARPCHALTIDLEDYFHTEVASQGISFEEWERQPSRIEASTTRLLELLDRNETQATFFVLGWVAKRYPRLVQQIHRRGHEIGCHSLNHQLVSRMSPDDFFETTRMAKDLIEDIVREPVLGHRAPCFSITPGCEWAFDALAELGFTYDSSVHPVRHPVYGNPTAPRAAYLVGSGQLVEFPIATWKLGGRNLPVGGGAYLRLLPYEYIRRGLTAWEREMQSAAMLYLHPWEIDPYQPNIPLSFQSRVRQTWGTATMEEKLQRLLSQFRFAPVRRVHRDLLEGKALVPRKSAEYQRGQAIEQVAG